MAQATDVEALVGRELLLDVACRLFMEHGFDGVSMQQIATAAHMTKGSPYYHFKGKEDLFLTAFEAQVQRANAGFLARMAGSGPLRERLVVSFSHMLTTIDPGMIRMMDDYRRLFEPNCPAGHPDIEATPEVMRRAYQEALEGSPLPLRMDAAYLAEALMAFQLGTMHLRVIKPGMEGVLLTGDEARRIAEDTIDLFLHGALVPEP
jgi:TetR/AcrR family transcriptional repressor of mexJK operon